MFKELRLFNNHGEEFLRRNDGHVGTLNPGTYLLSALVRREALFFRLSYGRINRISGISCPKNDDLCVTPLEFYAGGQKKRWPYTPAESRCLYAVHVDSLNGACFFASAFLAKQGGKWFARTQNNRTQLFNNHGVVVCPNFVGEKTLFGKYLASLFVNKGGRAENLPDFSKYNKAKEEAFQGKIEALGAHQGEVLWWDESRNYGVVLTNKGLALIFHTDIMGVPYADDALIHLKPGDKITYQRLIDTPNARSFPKKVSVAHRCCS